MNRPLNETAPRWTDLDPGNPIIERTNMAVSTNVVSVFSVRHIGEYRNIYTLFEGFPDAATQEIIGSV